MDNIPQLGTGQDLEIRAARIADPGVDLQTKYTVACELREIIDTVRDADSGRVLPQMVPALLDLLRSGEVAFHKDAREYHFRRVLIEILHRISCSEVIRGQAPLLFNGMLYLLRHDNEENGVTCCKTMIDIVRTFRALTQELVTELFVIFQLVLRNMASQVTELLSEESALVDEKALLPSVRSFKVLAEMGMVLVAYSSSHRSYVAAGVLTNLPFTYEVLALESPAQKETRENYEAMGGFWAGMASNIKNHHAYVDFIGAQIKIVSYVAYVMRALERKLEPHEGEILILASLRIMQDCPANAIASRRDLIIVLRHLVGTTHRVALLGQLDKLFNERVLLGVGVGSQETLRPQVYALVADLVHHLRTELNPTQMARIMHVFSRLMHNPYLSSTLHTMIAKTMFNLVDPVVNVDTPQNAGRLLGALLETTADRLGAMTAVQDELERIKNRGNGKVDIAYIERSRPVAGAVYAVEKPEEAILECRLLLRTLLHGFRVCLIGLKKCDVPTTDGTVIFRVFEGSVRSMSLFDADQRDVVEAMDWFAGVLGELNLHVFQEVWTHKIEFFFELALKRPNLLHICQCLFIKESSSPTLVAIVLHFLIDRLPKLGEYDDPNLIVVIKLYKMTFNAVQTFPQANEPILASHMAKLIMDCFPLAAKATRPTNYLHLLRGLFRAIGSGGGRFELLYQEVLPLLPEMLECLNRQLLASEGNTSTREMIVELCLTVPLRLTHLLPHLSYLMHPLALALRGNPELVSQGLRTLELCIDNLTPDFLDPTLSTVLRELMEALHSHLKPLPANHHHAHTTIRILGKLGGRNRRLLTKEPALQYKQFSRPTIASISSGSSIGNIDLGPMSTLASRTVRRASSPYSGPAYQYLVTCLNILVHEDIQGHDQEDVFVKAMKGIFDATHVPELKEQAQKFVRDLSHAVFSMEIRRATSGEGVRRNPSPLLLAYLEGLPHALAREKAEEAKSAQGLVSMIIQDLVAMAGHQDVTSQDIIPPLHQIASRFSALCLEDSWIRKSAGCSGIRIMTCTPDLGVKWINDREVDLVRTLLHILKDLASDLPRDVDDVVDVLTRVLRVSNGDTNVAEFSVHSRNKLIHLIGIFCAELQSPNAVVRHAAQTSIELLTTISGKSAHELLMPHRDRMLQMIYAKPLRALPFPIQIGMIEAIRYFVSLDPPLPELDTELLRLLHECLAAADADDNNLLGGRGNPRQGSIEVIKLRVACIKLLTASMPMTEFFSKHHTTRQRVTSVYFKSLYSLSSEVKDVAHEGLRAVLKHQNRLPKELLQTGLRPILMNLADAKRLSVSGLEGLARLLELLMHYFKVEIGHKLLDHFRVVADPQMLQASSKLPLADNESITKLVRLANIFHLLPSAANIFLQSLVNAIVQTEAHLHFSSQSPFSVPLAKYLNRYPAEAADYFMGLLHMPRYVRTLRSILYARLAPQLERELVSRTNIIVAYCLGSKEQSLLLPGLLLLDDLADLLPTWIAENAYVIDVLLEIWRSEIPQPDQSAIMIPEVIQRHEIILSIFMKALAQSPRIDLLFDIVSIYTRNLAMDLVRLTHFLYRHVALSEDIMYRRNVLMRFLTWFDDPSYPWSHKTYFLRFIVTPILLVHASRSTSNEGLLDAEFIRRIHRTIWHPMIDDATFGDADDMFKIELLHLTTVMVHHYPEYLEDFKKDIIRCAWHYITSDDVVIKHTAYLLAARFFEAFDTPQKFILRAWTGLLRPPHGEGRVLIRQALDILAPALPRSDASEVGYPQWARTTRRLLAEEGNGSSQIIIIYHLIVRQSQLFFPVRALFIPHMVNSLQKLGLSASASGESRLLSIDILQVIFEWEQSASKVSEAGEANRLGTAWTTPLAFRETMVSYLVRLATAPHEIPGKAILLRRALTLLRSMVCGWTDVTVKLHYFSRTLEQNDLNTPGLINQANSAAMVLQIVASDKADLWYLENALILQKLISKGLITDETELYEALHPVFERLHRLFPLPKEDDEQHGDMAEFHTFVYTSVGDGLRNNTTLRSILQMLKSVVQVVPERVDVFGGSLVRLLGKLTREHVQSAPNSNGYEAGVQLIITTLEICEISVVFLGEQRKGLLHAVLALIEKSRSIPLCQEMLRISRNWALHHRDPYPTMKEKATLIRGMVAYEMRGEALFHNYLQLIFDVYSEPTLRRSDLTTRLEHSFLLGCRAREANLREKFVALLDASVPRLLSSRLTYILGVQSWEALADHNWIYLALHLLLGTVDGDSPLKSGHKGSIGPSLAYLSGAQTARNVVQPMQRLLFLDPQTAHDTWVAVFPDAWALLSRREQADITHHMITLLSKDYHIKQVEMRPNVVQTLLTGALACSPPMTLPPHLVKYLAKTYDAWHVALEILEASLHSVRDDEITVRDTVFDSLADVYAELAEDDMFYGLWRRRCLHQETNIAIAFEQNGMWEQASNAYESAQAKSRAGSIPFSEPEYCLWEDHWMLSAEKLQSWEALYEFAKQEGNQELQLESAWRIKDWADNRDSIEEQVKLLPEVATPRRRVFEAFIALLKAPGAVEKNVDFMKILEDAMQLSLRKWVGLPPHLSAAHVPLLQHFQQFVELQEAVQIFGSLSATNAQNLEKKSSELKMVLQAWRERLPDLHDDISIWSDLVAWRQNVFNAINKAYIPLINNNTQGGGATANSANTYGYRGYHETAWIINRFAHVARKHDLLDVCFSSLNKIYTLPNIEISEAFLKLREQARCHYQKPNDLQAGLEVINNTNLMYFSISQKAEFYTLKGMFHARFGRNDDANVAFGQAVQLDISQAKAWAEWGRFNDRMFKAAPADMALAAAAVSCYLQAAGQYKSGKSRPLLSRVLWLISVDDDNLTVSRAFDTYKGDGMFWYWITFIPQLLASMTQREVKQVRYILYNIGKNWPQALFFPLRTTREEMSTIKKQAMAAAAAQTMVANQLPQVSADNKREVDQPMRDATGDEDQTQKSPPAGDNGKSSLTSPAVSQPNPEVAHGSSVTQPSAAAPPVQLSNDPTPAQPKQPWEYVDEILNVMKTGHPLMVLTIETMVDQILQRFKATSDEEIYRLVCMLLGDAVQGYATRASSVDDDGQLASMTVANLQRMVANLTGSARKDYEEDFLRSKPNQYEYVQRLQQWRDRYEKSLKSRPRIQSLDLLSHYLAEFQYGKFDDIEVPGQYTEDKDSNQNFVRIQKFGPKFENCLTNGQCWRRFIIHGSDNSKTSFSVQLPSPRFFRREDKVTQILRTFNGALSRKKESRKRRLTFHLPAAISLSPGLRLLQTDASYIALSDIYDEHCESLGITREDPILVAGEKIKQVVRNFRKSTGKMVDKAEFATLKKEVLDEVIVKLIPEDVITRYMIRTMNGPSALWRMRKEFASQIATTAFITHVFCMTSRTPSRFHLSRTTGQMFMSDLVPGMHGYAPILASGDAVPFRFTPNMQNFVGPICTEGILTSHLMAIGRCLTEPEFDLDQQLCLFARDEVTQWLQMRGKPVAFDLTFRKHVAANIDSMVARAELMACKIEREQAVNNPLNSGDKPVIQTVTNLICQATNPAHLNRMAETYHPWF